MRGTTLHYTQAHIRNVDRRLHLLRSKKELTGDINQWNVPACTIRRLSMPWTTECFVPIIAFQVPVTQAASETTFFISETPGWACIPSLPARTDRRLSESVTECFSRS